MCVLSNINKMYFYARAQYVLLFLVLAGISAWIWIYVVTHSYSSCPFLCALDDVYVAAETVNCLYILPN